MLSYILNKQFIMFDVQVTSTENKIHLTFPYIWHQLKDTIHILETEIKERTETQYYVFSQETHSITTVTL